MSEAYPVMNHTLPFMLIHSVVQHRRSYGQIGGVDSYMFDVGEYGTADSQISETYACLKEWV